MEQIYRLNALLSWTSMRIVRGPAFFISPEPDLMARSPACAFFGAYRRVKIEGYIFRVVIKLVQQSSDLLTVLTPQMQDQQIGIPSIGAVQTQ